MLKKNGFQISLRLHLVEFYILHTVHYVDSDEIANPKNFEHCDFGKEFAVRQKKNPDNFARTCHKKGFSRTLEHQFLNDHGIMVTHAQDDEEYHQKIKRKYREVMRYREIFSLAVLF